MSILFYLLMLVNSSSHLAYAKDSLDELANSKEGSTQELFENSGFLDPFSEPPAEPTPTQSFSGPTQSPTPTPIGIDNAETPKSSESQITPSPSIPPPTPTPTPDLSPTPTPKASLDLKDFTLLGLNFGASHLTSNEYGELTKNGYSMFFYAIPKPFYSHWLLLQFGLSISDLDGKIDDYTQRIQIVLPYFGFLFRAKVSESYYLLGSTRSEYGKMASWYYLDRERISLHHHVGAGIAYHPEKEEVLFSFFCHSSVSLQYRNLSTCEFGIQWFLEPPPYSTPENQ